PLRGPEEPMGNPLRGPEEPMGNPLRGPEELMGNPLRGPEELMGNPLRAGSKGRRDNTADRALMVIQGAPVPLTIMLVPPYISVTCENRHCQLRLCELIRGHRQHRPRSY
ncbi:MAG TPA: hypothetical protein PKM59_15935, partial [Thermodesulfobacteriota bacterium]|nr:hypothetical protein [Thermodesulfobacteriota bacterium]